ncbi:AAA family ATPase [Microbacterium sp.]|uniref:AAA family ATPase n=1 Tax=Microbacterium sp. TaxID=51671 RepID=UPI002736913C|nr:AAA family ATPase [Microbacterium sp.]MDP3950395.1 AAA family ATPase [Microbacterium sp.]
MLSADDPLPFRPERVLIAGVTGSGKTTLARRLGQAWSLEHTEIDSLFHGPDWTPRPEFLDDVRAFAATERWVTEWQYTSKDTDEIMTPRAQLAIWLDYPYRVVRSRLIRRTLWRSILRTEMYNGNVEKPIWKLLATRDPEENILAWQTKTRGFWTEKMPGVRERFPHLTIVRFSHPRETERWLHAQSVGR